MSYSIPAKRINQWRQWAKTQAIAAGVPVVEVDWFLQALSDIDSLMLRIGLQKPVQCHCPLPEFTRLWEQRCRAKIPVQYLVQKTPWREFELTVSPAVLIPRPETEYIIDILMALPSTFHQGHWVDLGTGSGAIALGLAQAFPAITVHAVDCSAAALAIAQANAIAHGLGDRIQFEQGSWWEPLQHLRGNVSAMVSNPPYIPSDLLEELQPEVYDHEPHLALDGGEDGLDDIRLLVSEAPDYLVSGGVWLIELMRGQGASVAQLLQDNDHYHHIQVINDLSGGDRYVLAYRS